MSLQPTDSRPDFARTRISAGLPQQILQEVFGYSEFRDAQHAIIEHVCAGADALVLMPTGGGKSLCYQIPAIARHRTRQRACASSSVR